MLFEAAAEISRRRESQRIGNVGDIRLVLFGEHLDSLFHLNRNYEVIGRLSRCFLYSLKERRARDIHCCRETVDIEVAVRLGDVAEGRYDWKIDKGQSNGIR